jgi:hypothetical protein
MPGSHGCHGGPCVPGGDREQVDLNLLGALVHLDKVHLLLTNQASQLTWAAKKSGLATTGTGVTVAVQPASGSSNSAPSTSARHFASAQTICPVLDLTHGPRRPDPARVVGSPHTVHLTINADSEGGVLGSLLCSLAGTP